MQHPRAQQDAEEDQGDRVEGVVQGEKGDHPPHRVVTPHPGLAQGPEGQHDPPRSRRREEQGRGQAGHVDLVGLAPAQPQRIAPDHGLEESGVGGEGDHVEADRDGDPERIGFVELAQRVAEADQPREEEVDPDQ